MQVHYAGKFADNDPADNSSGVLLKYSTERWKWLKFYLKIKRKMFFFCLERNISLLDWQPELYHLQFHLNRQVFLLIDFDWSLSFLNFDFLQIFDCLLNVKLKLIVQFSFLKWQAMLMIWANMLEFSSNNWTIMIKDGFVFLKSQTPILAHFKIWNLLFELNQVLNWQLGAFTTRQMSLIRLPLVSGMKMKCAWLFFTTMSKVKMSLWTTAY